MPSESGAASNPRRRVKPGAAAYWIIRFSRMMKDSYAASAATLLPLARELLHRDTEFIGVHAVDDLLFFGIKLLPGRGDRGLIDQRLGAADCGRRILRQPFGEFSGRRLQFCRRDNFGDQAPIIGLLRGKTVFGKKDLQRAADADGADHADVAAAVL